MGPQQPFEFLIEALFPMVLFLTVDVPSNGRGSRVAHSEYAVSRLPTEPTIEGLADPPGRCALDVLDQLRRSQGRLQAYQQMHVVMHATDTEKHAIQLLHDTTDVAIGWLLNISRDPWIPVLGRKNNMIPKLVKILSQNPSPLKTEAHFDPFRFSAVKTFQTPLKVWLAMQGRAEGTRQW